jgi:hypothetical protein
MFANSRALDSFDQYLFDVEKYPLIEDPSEESASWPAVPGRVTRRRRSGS